MNNKECTEQFGQLSTPTIADACVRLKLAVRSMPAGIVPSDPLEEVQKNLVKMKSIHAANI